MKNKLNKEYLLDLYNTENVDNMIYALTMLKSLGLSEWFKTLEHYDYDSEIEMIEKNLHLIDMFDLDTFADYQIHTFILNIDNVISYFNQEQLNRLDKDEITDIINHKPELEKHLINCINYGK